MNKSDEKLLISLARAAAQWVSEFSPQQLANTAWTFATANQSDLKLFTALVRAAD